jgi:hypothetical protein
MEAITHYVMSGAKLSYSYIGYKTVVNTVSVAGNISLRMQEDTRVMTKWWCWLWGAKENDVVGFCDSVSGKVILNHLP